MYTDYLIMQSFKNNDEFKESISNYTKILKKIVKTYFQK